MFEDLEYRSSHFDIPGFFHLVYGGMIELDSFCLV
jgi:hypothetical protein